METLEKLDLSSLEITELQSLLFAVERELNKRRQRPEIKFKNSAQQWKAENWHRTLQKEKEQERLFRESMRAGQ
jgi:hypothetical protein